ARGRALTRLKLPCAGGVRVTPAGQNDTAYRLINSAQFFIRAPARFIYIRLTAEIVESLL
ncbi:hypothetical protein, partial [uncultured Rikenella sp.]|uniref:hypothetical protein n=1 Tax=uncultured Rikenella sp. TaxID=368003 RepID=UPI0026084F8C